MHTDVTLDIMDDVTTSLGSIVREFQTTVCSAYQTSELPREEAARHCREAKQAGKSSKPLTQAQMGTTVPKAQPKVELNLETYKFHSLGDYVEAIRYGGTTDSYTTEVVSSFVVL